MAIAVHSGHLFLGYPGGQYQHSAPGNPHTWSALLGAESFAIGDEITAMLPTTGGVLVIASAQRVFGLYGSGSKDWEQRDLLVGTATAGGNTVATDLLGASFIEVLRNRLSVMAAGATMLTGLVGNVAIPRQTAAASAFWVAENGAPTESQQAFDQVSMSPKTVGAFTDVSRRLLLQSSLDVEAFVRMDLAKVIALAIDLGALNGSGAANQPRGVLQTSGIGSVAIGTNGGPLTWDAVVDLETAVGAANADEATSAYVTNASLRGRMKKTPELGNTANIPIWRNGEVNGYRAIASNQVPNNLTKGTGTNLSFESGDLTGWTITDGATLDHTVTTTLDGVSAAEGTYWYAYYTGSDNASEIQRVFDLTSIASNDELDDGAKIEVSFKHIALQATSRVKMTLVARNDALSTIGSVDTGWLTSVATNAFDLATMSFSVPSGTRTVLMKIATDDPGTSCKAGVDQILPILKTREGISFLSLPDTPSAYTGAESKLVRVNAGGTGLEFWSLSTTFLAASDTPSSYGGQTLKLVRVNAAETALEFVAAYTVPAGGTTGQALVKSSNADGAVGWASISTSSIALDDLTDVATSGAATGKVLTYDGSSWVPAAVVRPIAFFFTSTPASNEVLALYTACESISLPANFTGAVGNVGTNPTGSFVLNVQKNGATVGTITIATGGGFTFATSGGSAVSLVSGDQLKVVAPASADATIANVSITLKGTAS